MKQKVNTVSGKFNIILGNQYEYVIALTFSRVVQTHIFSFLNNK